MGGHGPAQLARRVLVAPSGCRRAPARSATGPTCTLPDRTASTQSGGTLVKSAAYRQFMCLEKLLRSLP